MCTTVKLTFYSPRNILFSPITITRTTMSRPTIVWRKNGVAVSRIRKHGFNSNIHFDCVFTCNKYAINMSYDNVCNILRCVPSGKMCSLKRRQCHMNEVD